MTAPDDRRFPLLLATSRQWLTLALTSSLVVALFGSLLMLALFRLQEPVSAVSAVDSEEGLTVVIGRTPGGPTQWLAYTSALGAIQERTGMPVRVRYVTERSQVTEVVQDEPVEAAFVSIYQYLVLREGSEHEALVTPIIENETEDSAVLVVRRDSPYRTLDDLRGARIALGAGRSLAGYAWVYWLLEQNGTTPEEFFGLIRAGAEHDQNLERVQQGVIDATAVNRSQMAAWPGDAFRIVEESPAFGMPPLIVRKDLPSKLREDVLAALTTLRPGRGLPIDTGVNGFQLASEDSYSFPETLMGYVDESVTSDPWPEDQ